MVQEVVGSTPTSRPITSEKRKSDRGGRSFSFVETGKLWALLFLLVDGGVEFASEVEVEIFENVVLL